MCRTETDKKSWYRSAEIVLAEGNFKKSDRAWLMYFFRLFSPIVCRQMSAVGTLGINKGLMQFFLLILSVRII